MSWRGLFSRQQNESNLIQFEKQFLEGEPGTPSHSPVPENRFGQVTREKVTKAVGDAWESLGKQEAPTVLGATIGPSGQQIQQGLIGGAQALGAFGEYIDKEVFYGAGEELTKLKTKGDDALYQALDERGVKVDRGWLGFTTGAALAGAEAGLTGKILKPPKMPKDLSQRFTRILPITAQDTLNPAFATAGGGSQVLTKGTPSLDDIVRQPSQITARSVKQGALTNPGKGSGDYRLKTEYPPKPVKGELFGKKVVGTTTDVHHGAGLDKQYRPIEAHRSWENLKEGSRSPIVEMAESRYNIFSGDAKENLIDILGTNTKKRRIQTYNAISEQSGGVLHPLTVNDALGGSKLKPRQLSQLELIEFDELRKAGKVNTVDDYMDNFMSIDTGRVFPQGSFPDIKVRAPGSKLSDPPLEVIKITTAAQHKNRFNLIFDSLDKHGIDTTLARKNFNRKAIKTAPKLDMFGTDHSDVHRIINELETQKGNPLYNMQQSIESGKYRELGTGKATEMFVDSHLYQEQVAAHVLQYRYKKIQNLFTEKYPNGYKGLGETFDDLSKEAKQRFFRENANEIAVKGGLEKRITAKDINKPIEPWTDGMTDVFGWKPKDKNIIWDKDRARNIKRDLEFRKTSNWNVGDAQVTWYPDKKDPLKGRGQIDILDQSDKTNPKGFKALVKDFEEALTEFPSGTKVELNQVFGDTKRESIYTRLFEGHPHIKRNKDKTLGWIYTAP